MPNEYKMTPQGRVELTDEEQAQAIASRVKGLEVRKREVEEKTRLLLREGVEYPASSGIYHALTDDRLATYTAAKTRQDKLKYPRRFKARTGDIISLSSKAAHDAFDDVLLTKYTKVMDGELDLLEALYSAGSQAELDAIVDNR